MAKAVFLDFEKDLGEIAAKIEKLETEELDSGKSNRNEIAKLEKLKNRRTAEIYRELTPWQTAQVARHPNRPYTLDYIDAIFEDFHELHGDRTFADDQSIVGGLARLAEHAVMVIGHQKGRDTRERTRRNFGMTKPEGYRKALRLMKLAEKFNLPVFTFIDTPGAYPGIDAEERNQSEAIGRNIYELTKLRVPVISTVIGEGGSGGALAIAVADAVFMLQYSTYSVISPEGCASILWKNAGKAPEAAQALGLTAETLKKLGLIDKVISEPIGGAHSDPRLMASTLRKALVDQLKIVQSLTIDELLERMGMTAATIVMHSGPNTGGVFGHIFDFSGIPVIVRVFLALVVCIILCTIFTTIAGFFTAKFKMHPFISTMATMLVIFGLVTYSTKGVSFGAIDPSIPGMIIPRFNGFPTIILWAVAAVVVVWFIWNKTTFGKNLFAVGGNPEAASVSGISVFWVTVGAFVLAGILYGFGSWLECIRMVGSGSAAYGQGWEMDAIAACVVGGISFTGGIGKISGVVVGVFIFTALTYSLTVLGIDTNLQFVFSGIIILVAVTLDCLKYVQKK